MIDSGYAARATCVAIRFSSHASLCVFFYFIFNVRRIIKDASLGFSSGGRSWTTFL